MTITTTAAPPTSISDAIRALSEYGINPGAGYRKLRRVADRRLILVAHDGRECDVRQVLTDPARYRAAHTPDQNRMAAMVQTLNRCGIQHDRNYVAMDLRDGKVVLEAPDGSECDAAELITATALLRRFRVLPPTTAPREPAAP